MYLKSIDGGDVHVALLNSRAIVIGAKPREVPEEFVSDALKTGRVQPAEKPKTRTTSTASKASTSKSETDQG